MRASPWGRHTIVIPLEKPFQSAKHRTRGCRDLLRSRGLLAFRQARCLSEDHASLHPVARCDGADQRRVRDPRRSGLACPTVAKSGGVGTGCAFDRGVSSQHLHGHEPSGCRRDFDCIGVPMGPAALATAVGLVATLVHSA